MSWYTQLPASAKRLTTSGKRPRPPEWNERGYEAEDWWSIDAADFNAFQDVVAGYAEQYLAGAFGFRMIPLRHPEYPNLLTAYTSAPEWVGWDDAATAPSGLTGWYKQAHVRVAYRSPEWRLSGNDTALTVNYRPQTFPMRIPAGGGTVGGAASPEDRVRNVGGQVVTIQLHQLQAFNPDAWAPGTGTMNIVNNDVWRGIPAGCALFSGVGATKTTSVAGATTWTVDLPFMVREVSWLLDHGADGTLGAATYDGTNADYASADFATIFGF